MTRRLFATLAAVILISVALTSHFTAPRFNDISQRAHDEIALNHRKQLPADWLTTDLATLNTAMDKLTFELHLPNDQALDSLRLVGGRYCSLQGQLAAQLTLLDDNDQPCTLLVLPDTPELRHVASADSTQTDIKITTWRDQGLLFGLARNTAP